MITIVSGLPRSGTSMMMRMLESGGLPILKDGVRKPDEHNPGGYYELACVRHLADDSSWMPQAEGKAVKVVSALLRHLPAGHEYRVVFMLRDLGEVLASQARMLGCVADSDASGHRMRACFETHLRQIRHWIEGRRGMAALYVTYEDVLARPGEEAERVAAFLGAELELARMAAVVEPLGRK